MFSPEHFKKGGLLIPEDQGAEDNEHDPDEKDGDADQAFDCCDDLGKKYPDRVSAKGTQYEPGDQGDKSGLIHMIFPVLEYALLV